jgi:hypothetical protein
MKGSLTSICVLAIAQLACATASVERTDRAVTSDPFPRGRATPEGAACDLARAFISRDTKLFRSTVLRPYGPPAYVEFLDQVTRRMREEAARATPSPNGPKAIVKVFTARHLTREGPASYGYAAFGFQDVVFVDVLALLHGGDGTLNRTLVVKDKDGDWYVHPAPSVSPLLSAGLNDESPSREELPSGRQER